MIVYYGLYKNVNSVDWIKGLENKTFNPLFLRMSALRLHCSVYCYNLYEQNVSQFSELANSFFAVNASLIATATW